GKHPMLRIPAALEKGNKDRVLPMAPEFAELLLSVPKDQRHGRVFNPLAVKRRGERLGHFRVSELVAKMGKEAGVKVGVGPTGKIKHASLHDFRRSFGERWCTRVMPQILQELMRHESIDTTLRFYATANAQRTAAVLWEAHAVANANTSP